MNDIETNLKKNLMFKLQTLVEDCDKMLQNYGRKSIVKYLRKFHPGMNKFYFNEYKYELNYVYDNLEIARHILNKSIN